MKLLLPLILLIVVETTGFVLVGDEIGFAAVLVLILLTGFVGITCLKRNPSLAGAGVMLLIPGFLTDILGLLLLLPPVRRAVMVKIQEQQMKMMHNAFAQADIFSQMYEAQNQNQPRSNNEHQISDVIDADYKEIKDDEKKD